MKGADEPGTAREFRELFAYERWANRRILEAVRPLEPAAFTRDLGSSHGSIRGTLLHILGAAWIWLERWRGRSPSGFPGWTVSTFDDLEARWDRVEGEQRDFVAGLTDADVRATIEYRNTGGEAFESTLWRLLRHLVNHSTYHRGQVITLLRQLDAEPVSTDLVLFHRSRDGGEER